LRRWIATPAASPSPTALNNRRVTFKVKDYRVDRPDHHKTVTLDAAEFIRRFFIHVLPKVLVQSGNTKMHASWRTVPPSCPKYCIPDCGRSPTSNTEAS
jgi:hypothetical protein